MKSVSFSAIALRGRPRRTPINSELTDRLKRTVIDKLYFYAGGTKWGGGSFDPNHTGLAILRRDGFSSTDAGDTEGSLTTRLLQFTGKHLFVNVAAPHGTLRAEVLDEQRQPMRFRFHLKNGSL
jgi:hypothetical protein